MAINSSSGLPDRAGVRASFVADPLDIRFKLSVEVHVNSSWNRLGSSGNCREYAMNESQIRCAVSGRGKQGDHDFGKAVESGLTSMADGFEKSQRLDVNPDPENGRLTVGVSFFDGVEALYPHLGLDGQGQLLLPLQCM